LVARYAAPGSASIAGPHSRAIGKRSRSLWRQNGCWHGDSVPGGLTAVGNRKKDQDFGPMPASAG